MNTTRQSMDNILKIEGTKKNMRYTWFYHAAPWFSNTLGACLFQTTPLTLCSYSICYGSKTIDLLTHNAYLLLSVLPQKLYLLKKWNFPFEKKKSLALINRVTWDAYIHPHLSNNLLLKCSSQADTAMAQATELNSRETVWCSNIDELWEYIIRRVPQNSNSKNS